MDWFRWLQLETIGFLQGRHRHPLEPENQLDPETLNGEYIQKLVDINELGFITFDSQPGEHYHPGEESRCYVQGMIQEKHVLSFLHHFETGLPKDRFALVLAPHCCNEVEHIILKPANISDWTIPNPPNKRRPSTGTDLGGYLALYQTRDRRYSGFFLNSEIITMVKHDQTEQMRGDMKKWFNDHTYFVLVIDLIPNQILEAWDAVHWIMHRIGQ